MSAADDAAWRDALALALAPRAGLAEQFWMLDSDGALRNGRVPPRATDMMHDHARCLTGTSAPTSGAKGEAHWTIAQ